MHSPFDLTGKTVMITGAGTGIGRASAVLASQLGAKTVLVARNAERLQGTLSLLEGSGHLIEPFDLNSVDEIPQWMKRIAETSGPLWGVVHCAAMVKIQPLQFLKFSLVEATYRINVVAAFALAKGFRQRAVCGNGGAIVLLSSVAAIKSDSGNSPYAATKGALQSMTKTLAIELAPQNIRINCIAPSWIRTEMTSQSAEQYLTPDQLGELASRHPLGPGKPEDIASCVAFLLANSGRWITGTTLVVDGGFTAK
jgi:NAD(P)-dependent dehydrogenase (short-subunit alcohol dehydrogenase family)